MTRWLQTGLALFVAVALPGWAVASGVGAPRPAARPNFLVILADDLGYSDLGCYGSEIATPNLDGLARDGLRFTQFYNTARCWPTRASLLTGYYPQQVRRDTVPGVASGGAGRRPAWARLLPELLRPQGYRSYHSGKWHVDGARLAGGFEHSYSVEDHDRYFGPRNHLEDDRPLPAVPAGSGYYSSTAIADQAIRQLRAHREVHPDEPFFQYLCFLAPHFPLQAPAEDVARYTHRYRAGWDVLRAERHARQRALGLLTCEPAPVEREVGPPYHFPDALEKLGAGEVNRPRPWTELSDGEREFQAAKMAVHAAMVDRLDREVGRVLATLEELGVQEDTVVCFLSDNGASAEIMVRGDGHDPTGAAGAAGSFLCLGPGWSGAANTPFRRHKTWVHEGGIATPLIVHWPRGIRARGEFRRAPGHVIDLAPTLLELAGGTWPTEWAGHAVPPPPGRSIVPAFAADRPLPGRSLWWLHEGNRAFRAGDWKIVAAGTNAPWELYDLEVDRSERTNRIGDFPERARSLGTAWTNQWQAIQDLARRDLR
jgi:arylsulfatase